ncbi:hypothetical protein PF005_g17404 [Phytophthora fragariae]|uniref:Retrotransposon gag domain-containing protein n=1 Tax=Phytophthora fragariae TaxID=53985 RepID=A0A6A4D6J3_9STRA|nr:hypothetical protein PF003_g6746 [Phytophthora fragariae]KAE8931255.1 hypothetical protein PF009_g18677 [Phytophthora fragariae]KAE9139537.1 hypothetical protein PF006_g13719 [Phytophthora fragariae]KAE9195146.1 hypothetical protein PF005_g17404 [Phytophthora fragariae]KAE9224661.1 hypothetical protein PF002_g14627 [Phytophthora fragariae]
MSMSDYVQKTRHLVSCIATKHIDMASQVHVFVFGMREGITRYWLTRAEPATLEEAFALALREHNVVAWSYATQMPAEVHSSGPEPTRRRSASSGRPRGEDEVAEKPVRWSASDAGSPDIARLCAARRPQSSRTWSMLRLTRRPRPHNQKTTGTSRGGAPYWLEMRSRSPGGSTTF